MAENRLAALMGSSLQPSVLPLPALPEESPLDMPRHQVDEPGVQLRKAKQRDDPICWQTRIVRLIIALITGSLSGYGIYEMHGVLSTNSITLLQWLFLIFFSINFIWISFAFSQALLGFLSGLNPWRKPPTELAGEVPFTTAILLPVHREEPDRIAAAIRAMQADLIKKAPGKYAFFILSDTNHAEAWVAEEAAFSSLIDHDPKGCPVYYRKRLQNVERKAGNIADWVMRWGGAYDAMIILDADSIMSADTMLTLSRRLAAAPNIGLIQTLPTIVRANSLYGRLQQFANHCYGPIYARGLSVWHGLSSNFWGHNAIIRTRAFAEACALPILSGKPPFGGHVLSHDFIEAAFLRRAGWGVRFDTDITCSYEEAPPSLSDVLIRDRRWCQGNLQHSRILWAQDLALSSRIHILSGIFSYLSAVFWLGLIIVGLAIAIQALVVRPEYFANPSLFPTWPVFDAERALNLFMISMAVVFAPKLFGWADAMVHLKRCRAFGGPVLLTLSVLLESLFSALYAPILMVAQVGVVSSILLGRDSGWKPQARDDGALSWSAVWRMHLSHTLFGITLAGVAYTNSWALFFWLLPISGGLMLSMPLSWLSGGNKRARALTALGLLRAPEEKQASPILKSLQTSFQSRNLSEKQNPSLLHQLSHSEFCNWHMAQLPRESLDQSLFNSPAVTAEWKIQHAESLQQLESWLQDDERLALLSRRSLIAHLQQKMLSFQKQAIGPLNPHSN